MKCQKCEDNELKLGLIINVKDQLTMSSTLKQLRIDAIASSEYFILECETRISLDKPPAAPKTRYVCSNRHEWFVP